MTDKIRRCNPGPLEELTECLAHPKFYWCLTDTKFSRRVKGRGDLLFGGVWGKIKMINPSDCKERRMRVPIVLPQGGATEVGRRGADQFTTWLEVVLRERTIGRDEYREIFSRLDFLEKDFSVVFWKGTYERGRMATQGRRKSNL